MSEKSGGDAHRLVTDEVRAAVVVAYQRGDKIQAIEEEHSIARATVYWILEGAGITPDRVKRGRRLVGDDQLLAQLYDLITAQDKRIVELEALVANGGQEGGGHR